MIQSDINGMQKCLIKSLNGNSVCRISAHVHVFSFLDTEYTDVNFNKNIYGCLTKSILKVVSNKDEKELCLF